MELGRILLFGAASKHAQRAQHALFEGQGSWLACLKGIRCCLVEMAIVSASVGLI